MEETGSDETNEPQNGLTRDEVAKVANLAMLELTEEELSIFTSQLAAVLEHAKDVEALDVENVPPTNHPYPLSNVFRVDDATAVSADDKERMRQAVLATAPEAEDQQFKVPPALGEEL